MADQAIKEESASILDAVDVGVIVLDRQRRIVRWNAWMVSASGLTAEAAQGRSLTAVFPGLDNERLFSSIASALDTGVPSLLTHALHPRVFPLSTRSRRTMLHDVTVSAVGRGPDAACLIHITDVTMAVRRERYLRARLNARYDAIAANVPDAILTLDDNAVIRLANPAAAKHFGYSDQDLTGSNATMLFESQGAWNESWLAVQSEGTTHQPVELVGRRKDGTLTHLELSASRWQRDSHVFVTAILRDINERHAAAAALAELNATLEKRVQERTAQLLEAEEALRQSQKMEAIGQLTSGIAHDFNNLLQGIIGALNIVQKRVMEGRISDIARFLAGALLSAERASALTHRLLAFSRKQPVDPRPVDVNTLIGTMEELLRRSIGQNVRMKINGARDLWLIRCDANQLENALLNLAINARDAMPNGGTLTVSTANLLLEESQALQHGVPPGEYVRIAVSDDGVGMTPEARERAFEPFYTTKPIGQGTGLGLSMTYGFVRQSGGSVRIESNEGEGTTIEICIPRFEGKLEERSTPGDGAGERRTDANKVVLVVEDEDIIRLLVAEVLGELGYLVLEASDGSSALRILQSAQRIDLLVIDIGLPDVNGRQVADAGRAQRPGLKTLFMTGYSESAARSGFLLEGMQLISKPFTMDQIGAKISAMIERS